MAWLGGQYVITATATKLTTALGLSEKKRIQAIKIRNATGATAALYLGDSDVTNTPTNAHAQVAAATDYDTYSTEGWFCTTDDIYLVGTANAANIAFISFLE